MSGFPKAALISHLKILSVCLLFAQCGAASQDIMYITLPLYHISASLIGIGGCIELGNIFLSGNYINAVSDELRLGFFL